MNISTAIYDQILNVDNQGFDALALQIFQYQSRKNPIYTHFLSLIGCNPSMVKEISDIPFLPIQLYKTNIIKCGNWTAERVFESSGTSGQITSKHHMRSLDWYARICERAFQDQFEHPSKYCWIGLLPSYLERKNASLVQMVKHFIALSEYPTSGFFLNEYEKLVQVLKQNAEKKIPTVLIGVSFGLLDFLEAYPNLNIDMSTIQIIETGGMKGRREELTKKTLHAHLKSGFQTEEIYSEYGMTELTSQSYSKQNGLFYPSPTMRVVIGELTDPLSNPIIGKRGNIRIIDLANVDTCSFISTEDIGISYSDGAFEVLGRMDMSDLRGCSLMIPAQRNLNS